MPVFYLLGGFVSRNTTFCVIFTLPWPKEPEPFHKTGSCPYWP